MTGSARPPRTTFQPRFTLGLIYTFVFFFLWCLALALPDMLHVIASLPPDVDDATATQQVSEATRKALNTRLPWAFVGTMLTMAIAAWSRALPGMRGPRDD